jgi:hypothetical protein
VKAKQLVRSIGQIDPFQASIECLIVIAFPRTNSKNYAFAVRIAESAERYAVADINGQSMHIAVFGKTQVEAGRAATVLGYTQGWKGTLLFLQGRAIRDSYRVREVIECFLQSLQCSDTKAHCHEVVDDPKHSTYDYDFRRKKVDRYIFPCKHLLPWFRFSVDHPSSYPDQIQAAGVRHSCNVCPNFRPEDFKKIVQKPGRPE